jgi:TolA-binding protein
MDAQVESVRAEGQGQVEKLTALEEDLGLLRKREEKRVLASQEAARLNQLLRTDKKRDFLNALPKVMQLDLSPTERDFFETEARKVRRELSYLAYLTGVEHLRAERYHEATQSLREAIDVEADAPHSPQASFELARAYRALDQQKSAIYLLMKLTVASFTLDILDEATLLMAECQADIQLYNDAKDTLRSFLKRFPDSALRNDAKAKLAELELRH